MRTRILLLLAILFCVVLASNAQIDTGLYLIGGSFNMASAKNTQLTNGSTTNSLNANIQFGKAIKENTIVGLIASYGSSRNYYPSNVVDISKDFQYTLGVFCRKYKKLPGKFYFFGDVNAVYVYSRNWTHFNQTEWKTISNGALVAFVPGISYAACKNLYLELLMPNIISFSYSDIRVITSTPPSASKGHVLSFNSNLNSNLLSNFGIGFKFLLGK
jgi:hypothetical protein